MLESLSFPLFVVGAGLALVGQLLVLRDGIAGRTPAAGAAPSTAARAREGLWIAIPALVLVLTLWATWRALPRNRTPGSEGRSVPTAPAGPAASRA